MLSTKDKKQIQGKLPKAIFNHPEIQQYIHDSEGCLWGYIGHEKRDAKSDQLMVKVFKAAGYTNDAIAVFVCSRAGRHTMDTFYQKGTDAKRKKDLIEGMRWALEEYQDIYSEKLAKVMTTRKVKAILIERGDYVKAISGHFNGKRGWVSRVHGNSACVCWKGVWEHGIWTDLSDLKRTRKGKGQE